MEDGITNLLYEFQKRHSDNNESLSPPSKRVKVCIPDEPDISEEEYGEAIKELQGNQ